MRYRSWQSRERIIDHLLAGDDLTVLNFVEISPDEELAYRQIVSELKRNAVKKAGGLNRYYKAQIRDPFLPVLFLAGSLAITGGVFVTFLLSKVDWDKKDTYPLVAAASTIAALIAAAMGWAVAGWVAHRNARVQHTINIVSTRFSQPAYVNHVSRFNIAFGNNLEPRVAAATVNALENSDNESDSMNVQSLKYILNYYEFISAGIIRGDLDLGIVEANLKSNLVFFYEKCLPFILETRRVSPQALEHLAKMRNHFREEA